MPLTSSKVKAKLSRKNPNSRGRAQQEADAYLGGSEAGWVPVIVLALRNPKDAGPTAFRITTPKMA